MVRREEDADRIREQVVAFDACWDSQRLVLPLVADDEVNLGESQCRQRRLRLGLDKFATQPRRLTR
jgi:hypothetical protein